MLFRSDVGQATVEELVKSRALGSAKSEDVEKAKRAIFDWMAAERDDYVMSGLKSFLEARGTLVDQELLTLRARVAEEVAPLTKELLIRLSESAKPARAAKK